MSVKTKEFRSELVNQLDLVERLGLKFETYFQPRPMDIKREFKVIFYLRPYNEDEITR